MNKPLVSILIPVFNRERYIGACIKSALDQTISNIEVVVVDNASTDRTWQLCQEYASKDERVKIFRNESNVGPVSNWQRCIDKATGEYGKILFSDDLIQPTFIEKTLPLIKNCSVGFVFTSVLVGEDPSKKGYSAYEYLTTTGLVSSKQYILDSVLSEDRLPVSPGCALFRLNDLKNNLYLDIPSPTITDFKMHGAGPDLLIFLLTAMNYDNVGFINEELVFFRSHPDSMTISDKTGYLRKCYTQVRIWFLYNYMQTEYIDHLLTKMWLSECKKSKKLLPYRLYVRQFLMDDADRYIQVAVLFKTLYKYMKEKCISK